MSSAPINEESPQKVNEVPQVFEEDSDFDYDHYDYTDLVHKEV